MPTRTLTRIIDALSTIVSIGSAPAMSRRALDADLVTRIMTRSAKAATSAIAIRRRRSSPATEVVGATFSFLGDALSLAPDDRFSIRAMPPFGSSGKVFQRVLGTRLEVLAVAPARYGVDSAVKSATKRIAVGTQKRLLSHMRFISGSPVEFRPA